MKKISFNDRYGLTQAVLDGRKTQTRCKFTLPLHKDENYSLKEIFPERVFLKDGGWFFDFDGRTYRLPKKNCPQYKAGDIAAVLQDPNDLYDDGHNITCFSDGEGWLNKMFARADLMPHQICITAVRAERLQDISDEDCLAEGIFKGRYGSADTHFMDAYYIPKDIQPYITPRNAYAVLTDRIIGKGVWESNPYVWVYEFELVK